MINKTIIITCICLVISSLTIKAEEKQLDLGGVGNILENNFLVSGYMHGVIFNKTENDFIAAKSGAADYCKKSMSNADASVVFYPLRKHASYFSCVTSVQNKMQQYKLNENQGLCINYLVFDMNYLFNNNQSCQELKDEILPIYLEIKEKIEFEEQYSKQDFIIKIFSEKFSEITKLENDIIGEPNNLIIDKNIETCKRYSFKEGSELFSQCILRLIELGDFTLEDPNRFKSKNN